MSEDAISQEMQSDIDSLCRAALCAWGEQAQMDMVIEECAELQHAILKYRRHPGPTELLHLAEEFVDVRLSLEQLRIILTETHGVSRAYFAKETRYKLDRLATALQTPEGR